MVVVRLTRPDHGDTLPTCFGLRKRWWSLFVDETDFMGDS